MVYQIYTLYQLLERNLVLTDEPIVREVKWEDYLKVLRLQQSVGYPTTNIGQENWDWLWRDNPARKEHCQNTSIGWVLESHGEIVGYMGNFLSLYRYGDVVLRAATATGFAVHQSYRGFGLKLVGTFFRQQNIELFLNTTASDATGQVFERYKATRLPQRDFEKILFWAIKPWSLAKSVTLKKKCPALLVDPASYILGSLLKIDSFLRRRMPRPVIVSGLYVEKLSSDDIGDEFNKFWEDANKGEKRLLSYRDADTLRWRLSAPVPNGDNHIVACRNEHGALVGYVLVSKHVLAHIGLCRYRITDFMVQNDDLNTIDFLLKTVYESAVSDGVAMLESIGFPMQVRDRLMLAKPYARISRESFTFKTVDPTIQSELRLGQNWYASAFDGDIGW